MQNILGMVTSLTFQIVYKFFGIYGICCGLIMIMLHLYITRCVRQIVYLWDLRNLVVTVNFVNIESFLKSLLFCVIGKTDNLSMSENIGIL